MSLRKVFSLAPRKQIQKDVAEEQHQARWFASDTARLEAISAAVGQVNEETHAASDAIPQSTLSIHTPMTLAGS